MKSYTPGSSPQFQYHRKPKGVAGPCPICGCTEPNLRASHRALTAEESWAQKSLWVKRVSTAFGMDFTIEGIG